MNSRNFWLWLLALAKSILWLRVILVMGKCKLMVIGRQTMIYWWVACRLAGSSGFRHAEVVAYHIGRVTVRECNCCGGKGHPNKQCMSHLRSVSMPYRWSTVTLSIYSLHIVSNSALVLVKIHQWAFKSSMSIQVCHSTLTFSKIDSQSCQDLWELLRRLLTLV